jgi:autotransporter passenger strand-loop-strand repeat protein
VYGTASSTTVSSGGIEIVESGGYATGTTVLSGGEIVVYDGATVSGLTVSSGGSEVFVSSGGYFSADSVQHAVLVQPSAPSSVDDRVAVAPERTASRASTAGSDSLRLSSSDWQALLRSLAPEESSAQHGPASRNQAAAASPAMEATVANLVQAMASFHAGAAMGEGALLDHLSSGTLGEESPPLARVHHAAWHA